MGVKIALTGFMFSIMSLLIVRALGICPGDKADLPLIVMFLGGAVAFFVGSIINIWFE